MQARATIVPAARLLVRFVLVVGDQLLAGNGGFQTRFDVFVVFQQVAQVVVDQGDRARFTAGTEYEVYELAIFEHAECHCRRNNFLGLRRLTILKMNCDGLRVVIGYQLRVVGTTQFD